MDLRCRRSSRDQWLKCRLAISLGHGASPRPAASRGRGRNRLGSTPRPQRPVPGIRLRGLGGRLTMLQPDGLQLRPAAQRALTAAVRGHPDWVCDRRQARAGGGAAGIDLCLHMVGRGFGAEAANTVARRLVVAPHRSGGQAQYADRPVASDSSGGLELTRSWILQRLADPLTVNAMAAHAHVSRRTFARHFVAETGTSPLRWLLDQRVLYARRLLETTRVPIERVATRCGFGSSVTLRV